MNRRNFAKKATGLIGGILGFSFAENNIEALDVKVNNSPQQISLFTNFIPENFFDKRIQIDRSGERGFLNGESIILSTIFSHSKYNIDYMLRSSAAHLLCTVGTFKNSNRIIGCDKIDAMKKSGLRHFSYGPFTIFVKDNNNLGLYRGDIVKGEYSFYTKFGQAVTKEAVNDIILGIPNELVGILYKEEN